MTSIKIGIMGNGFVGKATSLFMNDLNNVLVYDIYPERCLPLGTTLDEVVQSDILFVCVPTPIDCQNKTHIVWVEKCVDSIRQNENYKQGHIVIRSTVPVGTSERLGCCMMPEFLTEKNWAYDFKVTNPWIFGIPTTYSQSQKDNIQNIIQSILDNALNGQQIDSSNINFTSSSEAEMIKYGRNNYLAMKIAFFNEIYDFSQSQQLNYELVRQCITADPRIGISHSNVPGYDGLRGFGGTCLPKDSISLVKQMKNVNMQSYIIDAVVRRNNEVDRPSQEWKSDLGRSFIHSKCENCIQNCK